MAFSSLIKARERPRSRKKEGKHREHEREKGKNRRGTEKNRGGRKKSKKNKIEKETVVVLQHALNFVSNSNSRPISLASIGIWGTRRQRMNEHQQQITQGS
jgi:hypothetical protein